MACSDDDVISKAACGVNDPIRDLNWLAQEVEERETNPTEDTKYCYITQAEYQGETVFVYWDCNPLIDKIIPIFDCDGNQRNGLTGSPIALDDLEGQRIIWRPPGFACNPNF